MRKLMAVAALSLGLFLFTVLSLTRSQPAIASPPPLTERVLLDPAIRRAALAGAPDIELAGQAGGIAFGVAVQGGTAYAGIGPSLVILNVSDPAHPAVVGRTTLPGIVEDVALSGNYAYVADYSAGLRVVDVSNPAAPSEVGYYEVPGFYAYGVAISGNYAYVAYGHSGLRVVDVSNPAAPGEVGSLPGYARGVAVDGHVYVADGSAGLRVVDVANPADPTEVGASPGNGYGVAVAGGYAYVADASKGVRVVDVLTPTAPTEVGYTSGFASDVAVAGEYAYAAYSSGGLQVVHVLTPTAPTVVGSLPADARGVAVAGSTAYVADYDAGLYIVDVSVPSAPTQIGSYSLGGVTYDVAAAGNYAYILDGHGVDIIDVSDPAAPARAGSYDVAASDVLVDGALAYVGLTGGIGEGGIRVVNVANPASPVPVGSYEAMWNATDMALVGGYLYVAVGSTGIEGLHIVDVSNSTAPIEVAYYETMGAAEGIAVAGGYAYVAARYDGLHIVDISDPANPTEAGVYVLPDYQAAQDVAAAGRYAYVTDGTSLRVIDVSDPANPTEIVAADLGASYVTVVGDYAYVVASKTLRLIDISNPAAPTQVAAYDRLADYGGEPVAAGGYLYVADAWGGIYLFTAVNNSRDTAQQIGAGDAVTDSVASTSDVNWYKVQVDQPGSTLSVTLTGLTEDLDLFLFAPEVDQETGQLRDIGTLANIGQMGNIGTLVGVSSEPLTATEQIAINVHELAGAYTIAIIGHTPEAAGQTYTLTALIAPPAEIYEPITHTIHISLTTPVTDTDVRSLILFNRSRLNQFYTGTDTITSSHLITRLSQLVDHLDAVEMDGVVVNLDSYAEIVAACEVWDAQPDNPLAANFVAGHVKLLLYQLAPAYPNLAYIVIVGDDRVIPHRRIRDEALAANERHYAPVAHTANLSPSMALRYLLSDDYYAGLLPLPWRGRELYLPQVAIGRLVERPSEMAAAIDAFLAQPVITPTDAVVTGYDFLIDQAQAISDTLRAQGITTLTTLINDIWMDDDFRTAVFTTTAHDLNSLNAHFQHHLLYPTHPLGQVSATEVTSTTDYSGTLAFSVGCHSGLNVPDEDATSLQTGTDWAQAFLRQGATLLGNTGYGYGDSDLIAYSERLMTNFVEELDDWGDGPSVVGDGLPTVGGALLRAKQRYYNSIAAGSLSNYDEKILAEMAMYGLPMLRVNMPLTTTSRASRVAQLELRDTSQISTSQIELSFDYISHTVSQLGTYYTISGTADVHVVGGRPVLPRASQDIHIADTIAHGALMVGGTFNDVAEFDPVISRVVTEELYTETEPAYPTEQWYPVQVGTVNRFLSIGGQSRERLVVVPAQFRAASTATPTKGTQRLYSELQFEVYHAPFAATDFIAPSIWQVEALAFANRLEFRVKVEDDSGAIERTVILYRPLTSPTWSKVELSYDSGTGWAQGSTPLLEDSIEYFAQAVDPTGNVALVLDHGNPFRGVTATSAVYLPLIIKSHNADT